MINEFKIKDSKFKISRRIPASRNLRDKQNSKSLICNVQSSILNLKSLMRSNGFSFIELMTVVAIMAVLVAASMPMFRNYTRGKNLKEGTNMVVSALRRTRNSAITDRKNYRVVFDTDNNTIAIDADTTDEDFATINDGLAENWKGLSEFVEFDTWVIKAGNSYAPGNPEIYFLEFKTTGGLSTGISDQTIVLIETSTQDTKAIRVNALTGKIGVLE